MSGLAICANFRPPVSLLWNQLWQERMLQNLQAKNWRFKNLRSPAQTKQKQNGYLVIVLVINKNGSCVHMIEYLASTNFCIRFEYTIIVFFLVVFTLFCDLDAFALGKCFVFFELFTFQPGKCECKVNIFVVNPHQCDSHAEKD